MLTRLTLNSIRSLATTSMAIFLCVAQAAPLPQHQGLSDKRKDQTIVVPTLQDTNPLATEGQGLDGKAPAGLKRKLKPQREEGAMPMREGQGLDESAPEAVKKKAIVALAKEEVGMQVREGQELDNRAPDGVKNKSRSQPEPQKSSKSKVVPAAETFSLFDAWITNTTDNDADGYFSIWRVNFDADVSTGSATVFARIYWRLGTGSFSLIFTTANFAITGNSSSDAFWVEFTNVAGHVRGLYDVRIELYKSGDPAVKAIRDDSNDSSLNDIHLESPSDDATFSIFDAWISNATDNDGDGYLSVWRVNFDADVSTGSATVFARIYWRLGTGSWASIFTTDNFTITGNSSSDAYWVEFTNVAGHVRGLYDVRIELYKSGDPAIKAFRDDSTDSSLNDIHLESPADDAGQTFSIFDAWITNTTDNDGDGYSSIWRVNFDADVSTGSATVFARIYWRLGTGSFSLIFTTANFAITGNSSSDAHWVEFTNVAGHVRGLYDVRIELYKSGDSAVKAVRDDSNDSSLNDIPLEGPADDTPLQNLTLRWVNASGTEITQRNDEDLVDAQVVATGYPSGTSFTANIYESDPLFDDSRGTVLITIGNDGTGKASWRVFWEDDGLGGGDPEFVFKVGSFRSAELSVRRIGLSKSARGTDLAGQPIDPLHALKFAPNYYLADATKSMFRPSITDLGSMLGVIETHDASGNAVGDNTPTSGNLVKDPNNDLSFSDVSGLFAGVSAHNFMGRIYDFYESGNPFFSRQSYDNNGATIKLVVHGRPDAAGQNGLPDNAFWDGQSIVFGDGATVFRNLAGSLDVAAHEFTHAVTDSEIEWGINYHNQTGALNESFSDVFGALVDTANWTIGEGITIPSPGFLRSLEDPHQSRHWQPSHMSEYVSMADDEEHDYGGVHTNSGIPNKAAHLIAQGTSGGTFHSVTVIGIGRTKLGRIYYDILFNHRLTAMAQFADLRNAALAAASSIYGSSSQEHSSIAAAFDAVGLGSVGVSTAKTTAGLYNPTASAFFLKNSNSAGPGDLVFGYGPAASGWTPIVGDWNGDGVDTVGLYNPTTSTFFLKNTNSAGPGDLVFPYGPAGAGWTPIVGDWDGNGTDTVGLFNPATSTFFLKNTNSAGPGNLVFPYGPAGAGWAPIVGDWDGNGTDTVGLFNPSTSTFFLKNTNSAGPGDLVFGYGPGGAGWTPLVGDWNGDGVDTIGLYNPATGFFFLKNTNAAGSGDLVFGYGPGGAGWKPIVGDWDGL